MIARSFSLPRTSVVAITALVMLHAAGLIFWQSFLNAPFFNPQRHFGVDSYAFIFADPDFWTSLFNSVVIAAGMVLIAAAAGRGAGVPADAHRPAARSGRSKCWC